jgi:outer membrane protein assembly factor BamA
MQAVRWHYQTMGYHKVSVSATCEGEQPTVLKKDCDPTTIQSRAVHVTIHVEENTRAEMGELFWHGLDRTKSSVIRRDLPKPGAPFDRQKLSDGVRKLRNLGIFASVRTVNIGLKEEPPRDRVAVVVYVEEASNRFLDLSAGFQTMTRETDDKEMNSMISDMLSGSIRYIGSAATGGAAYSAIHFPDLLLMTNLSYTDRNFLGRAKELTVPVTYGLSTTELIRYVSFKPTYRDRRFLATNVTLRLTPLIEYDRALRDIDTYKYGFETELSQRFFKSIYLSLRTEVSRIAWKRIIDDNFSDMDIQLEASPHIRFDYRNSPTNPTDGTYVGLRVSYLNAINESGDRDNFFKFDVAAHWYMSFRKTFVLATFLRFGNSYSSQGDHLPANHAFRLGGTSGMRGYPAGGIAQYSRTGKPLTETIDQDDGSVEYALVTDGDVLINGTIEFRFPLLRLKEIWGTAFMDFGALGNKVSGMSGDSFRFSVGTGVRWLLGGQIPIRLDYGIILDRRCGSVDPTTGSLSSCSQESFGSLDFGLLYTF